MLKVVVDTNVVVSALLKAQSGPALVLSMVMKKQLRLCLSEEILSEYTGVLARDKFRGLDRGAVRTALADLRERSLWIEPRVTVQEAKEDPADNAFLECALEAQADFLITGNTKHFPHGKFHNTQIVTPREFLDFIASNI